MFHVPIMYNVSAKSKDGKDLNEGPKFYIFIFVSEVKVKKLVVYTLITAITSEFLI